MSNKTVVILNGPPGSGKDTIADGLNTMYLYSKHCQFKKYLYGLTAEILGMDKDIFTALATRRDTKDSHTLTNVPICNFMTPREALIHVSENIIKPGTDKYYFGKRALNDINKSDESLFIFSDGGFVEEIEVLSKAYKTIIIHLHRDGCTFDNDSRRYVEIEDIPCYKVENNGTIEDTLSEIKKIINEVIDENSD